MPFEPKFTISIPIASVLTAIERTRGFLEAATLSKDWISKMQARFFPPCTFTVQDMILKNFSPSANTMTGIGKITTMRSNQSEITTWI